MTTPITLAPVTLKGPRELAVQPFSLDPSLLTLADEESAFFKKLTGIEDDDVLRRHILQIQEDAYTVFPYPCIRLFWFARLKMSKHPKYGIALSKGSEQNALFLDIGCCFGYDVRKLVLDGFPVDRVLASDLEQGFWDLGNRLFTHSPKINFLSGDIFNDHLLASNNVGATALPSSTTVIPDLTHLTTLTPLLGKATAIHAASLFHIFSQPQQRALAHRFASLLSPVPGSLIFGSHIGLPHAGTWSMEGSEVQGVEMWCHDAESWKALWDGDVFEKGSVKVEANVRVWPKEELMMPEEGGPVYELVWSVQRL